MEISVDYYCNGGGGAAGYSRFPLVVRGPDGWGRPSGQGPVGAAPFLPAAFITNNAFALQSILGGKRISIVILLQA